MSKKDRFLGRRAQKMGRGGCPITGSFSL